MKTTLNKIRDHEPCNDGWETLLKHLGKTKADDEPLEITTIIDSNGVAGALWCLRAVKGKDKEIRLFAVWCARQVQHLMKDQRSIDALDVAERYANGEATEEERSDADWAAASAVRAADWAVRAASDAANAAAYAIADWAAARAASAAAYYARAAAARAAGVSAWAADDDDARAEMESRQEAELRRICVGVRDEKEMAKQQAEGKDK